MGAGKEEEGENRDEGGGMWEERSPTAALPFVFFELGLCEQGGGWRFSEARLITVIRCCCQLFELVWPRTQQEDTGDGGGYDSGRWAVTYKKKLKNIWF